MMFIISIDDDVYYIYRWWCLLYLLMMMFIIYIDDDVYYIYRWWCLLYLSICPFFVIADILQLSQSPLRWFGVVLILLGTLHSFFSHFLIFHLFSFLACLLDLWFLFILLFFLSFIFPLYFVCLYFSLYLYIFISSFTHFFSSTFTFSFFCSFRLPLIFSLLNFTSWCLSAFW